MNLTLKRRLWYQLITKLVKNVHSSMWVLLEMVARWNIVLHWYYGWHGEVITTTTILSSCLFNHKASIGPIKTNLLLQAAFCSPNLNKFAKLVHNVVSSFSLHSRWIGLEVTHIQCLWKKMLDVNSYKLNKGIFTFNIPMKNCPPLFTHQSLNPLCPPLSTHMQVLVIPFKIVLLEKFQWPLQHLWQNHKMIQQLHLEWWFN